MKVFGVVVLVLGFIVIYIGITGSQHRIMAILKGVHLAPNAGSGVSATAGNSGQATSGTTATGPATGAGGKKKA